jgi:hypothetical protein
MANEIKYVADSDALAHALGEALAELLRAAGEESLAGRCAVARRKHLATTVAAGGAKFRVVVETDTKGIRQ